MRDKGELMKEKSTSNYILADRSTVHHTLQLLKILDETMERTNAVHLSLMENQSQALAALSGLNAISNDKKRGNHVLNTAFSRSQLEEFANGSIAKCFGLEYGVLDHRKAPRIPNGRLLLIDRVMDITGNRMQIHPPASIITEVDIPIDAWFLIENSYQGIPLSILMEMALQPCGILSAYLGTSLVIPAENNLFRNLDGWIILSKTPEFRGKTISNRAELTRTIASAGLYIQTYKFELSVDGSPFLSGESSFGYFTQPVMDNQNGLDLGEKRLKIIHSPVLANNFQELMVDTHRPETKSLLDLSDKIWHNSTGGRYGQGVVVGRKMVQGDEWFFENHFYQDPVMPGSLGVEVITRGLHTFIKEAYPGLLHGSASIQFPDDKPMRWKYRGQVLPSNHETYYEAHIREKTSSGNQFRITADADFWVDDLRIYSIENLVLTLKEGMK